ncbi:hypothetical protein MATL_G00188420 [Megalops atlanticus]|uniref:Receptor protein-tyrosine kinase n=1 Tax=Megalops atlanticus TaxID=7932 RepID=A0A9D3SZ90_MEGAT|nr:hypothetical protein MATL_G00188420 [Megalops atlanticus]
MSMRATYGLFLRGITLVVLLFSEGSSALYFPQNEYTESVYVGQEAGTPVIQLHGMLDSPSERPHFYLCWNNLMKMPAHALWFQLDEDTGVLSLNKTLDWKDFASLSRSVAGPVKKLILRVMATLEPVHQRYCHQQACVTVTLNFINATAPLCAHTKLERLCFADRDPSPHIKENRLPGAFRQLRRLTRQDTCPNFTISYSLEGDLSVPFAINENTSELVVTRPVDREEREMYSLDILCTVRTEAQLHKIFGVLLVNIYDEDDNPPYINGSNTEEVVLEFNRKKGSVFGSLLVCDRDTTPIYPKDQSQNKFVGQMVTHDAWIKETFSVEHSFREEKVIFGNVRGTVHEYKLVLNKDIPVTEKRSLQLDYLVNDTTFAGPEGTVMLHFNVTILPVQIAFTNITYRFMLSRKAASYSQIGQVCVDDCLQFQGINVAYRLAMADRNLSASVKTCYTAVGIAQSDVEASGILYVNHTEAFRKAECQELLYIVTAQEQQKQLQARTQLLILFDSEPDKDDLERDCPQYCAERKERRECESCSGLGAPTGRCQWRQGAGDKGISRNYSTCSPDLRTCPDGYCDVIERKNKGICPQDCTTEPITGGHERGVYGIRAGYGTCYCYTDNCFCEKNDIEEPICDDMCKTIIATAVLLSFIVSVLLSSYFIHRYHKNSPKPPIASAEMTFRRPAQSYPISYSANNVRRPSLDSMENQVAIDTFKIPEDPKWEFPRKNLVLGKTLGEGEFGKVVKATAFRLKGKAGYTTVAVKMLKENASHSELRDLLSEFTLLKQVNHPHVIKMYGACSQDGPLYLIVEYAKYGSLRNFLRESRKVGPSYVGSDANRNSSYLENPDERC